MKEAPYGPDLALIHHLGFSGYSDLCAPGVVNEVFAGIGFDATVRSSFGDEHLPEGMRVLVVKRSS